MGTHPIFESDFDCLTEMDRLLYTSLSSTGRKLLSTKVQSDLKQKSIEDKIQLFPLAISPTNIRYAVVPISLSENGILKEYEQYNSRSVIVLCSLLSSFSAAVYFAHRRNYLNLQLHLSRKGWAMALFGAYGLLAVFLNDIRRNTVKIKLDDFIPSDENNGL